MHSNGLHILEKAADSIMCAPYEEACKYVLVDNTRHSMQTSQEGHNEDPRFSSTVSSPSFSFSSSLHPCPEPFPHSYPSPIVKLTPIFIALARISQPSLGLSPLFYLHSHSHSHSRPDNLRSQDLFSGSQHFVLDRHHWHRRRIIVSLR